MMDRKSEFCLVSLCIQLFSLLVLLKTATETHQHMFGWRPLKARVIQFGQSALAFSINFSYVPFSFGGWTLLASQNPLQFLTFTCQFFGRAG